MNTTKRKFTTLLNGLGSKPNASSSSLKTDEATSQTSSTKERESMDSQFKKRRTNNPNSSIPTVLSQPGSTTTFPSTQHKKAVSAVSAEKETSAPTYAPWDRDAFLKRLKTFATLTDWFPKPERVNEVEWAKRGWVCGKRERVRCCSCNVELLVKLNKKVLDDGTEEGVYIASNIDVEEQLVDKYAELIVTAHAEDCLWRARGCDDTIFKLPLNKPSTTLQAIRERYNGLAALGDALPYPINIHPPENFDLDKIISYLPRDFFAIPATNANADSQLNSEINRVALTMALFGWGAMQNHTHSAAECTACFRRLGLWLFKSKEVSPTGAEVVGAAMNHLDLIKEHRDYCPWKNATAQSGSTAQYKLAAWEIILRVLRNDYYLRNPEAGKKSITGDARSLYGDGEGKNEEEVRSIREEKDKEWSARLRRVKSLFNTKEKKKINRLSAPAPKPAVAKDSSS